jgi:ribosome-associated translation inhibitor RaiA
MNNQYRVPVSGESLRIQMNHQHDDLKGRLRWRINRRIFSAIRPFRPLIRDIFVRIRDENGPKGGTDIRCLITVKLRRGEDLAFSAQHEHAYGAAANCATKLRRSLVNLKKPVGRETIATT